MFKYCRIILAAILVLPLIIGCSKSTKTECPPLTPRANEEAELVALCLSGQLVAPAYLYQRVLDDLKAIRTEFGNTFEAVRGIGFSPPWVVSCILMSFDDTTGQQVFDEKYHAWDELNEMYRVTRITRSPVMPGFGGSASLYFEGRLNPARLAELYEVLPGVRYAEPNFWYGDGPNVYVRQTDFGFSYLFRYAYGDCPSGCIYNEYWYFVCEGGGPVFIGHWVFRSQPEPEWWQEARLNREHYCDP